MITKTDMFVVVEHQIEKPENVWEVWGPYLSEQEAMAAAEAQAKGNVGGDDLRLRVDHGKREVFVEGIDGQALIKFSVRQVI